MTRIGHEVSISRIVVSYLAFVVQMHHVTEFITFVIRCATAVSAVRGNG